MRSAQFTPLIASDRVYLKVWPECHDVGPGFEGKYNEVNKKEIPIIYTVNRYLKCNEDKSVKAELKDLT